MVSATRTTKVASGAAVVAVVTFELNGARFGMLADAVREVYPAVTVTPLPRAPASIEGLVDVRGTISPVYDLRSRLGLAARPQGLDDHMIIARARAQGDERLVVVRVDRAIDLANLTMFQPDHAVELVIQPGLRCHGDRALIQVVLENLLGNAWKFTRKQPHPRVEVGADNQGGAMVFFIRDNGAGFDMERAHRLFLPFERLHSEAEFKGTGVGLTTARRVVERHGGRIWAEAAPDRGATFFFTVPAPGA